MEIQHDVPLAKFSTWRIGGRAETVYLPKTIAEAQEAIRICLAADQKPVILGGGSNLLISDRFSDMRRPVIRLADNFAGVTFEDDRATALAGTRLMPFCQSAMTHGLGGMEFISGVPGTIGGAVVMNAGCWGDEMAAHIVSVTLLQPDGEVKEAPASELGYSYRHSALQDSGTVVLAATLQMTRLPIPEIAETLNRLKIERNTKQPTNQLNAGSVFRNPPGDFAARLIDQAGAKGLRCGQAQISDRHANFLVNLGGAKADEVYTLIHHVQQHIRATTGIDLQTEVVLIGDFAPVPGWTPEPAAAT
ncbi:MAG: UDP-N-acetylmuramate dehydrogenase [Candidatus Sericytochromatia bacterium]|nr:UDP-N-acetylmuramate dehydrogenase [Candidatus Sericytochromatia bacterium]